MYYSFLKILAKNCKKTAKGINSNKELSNNFDPMEIFVEFVKLKKVGHICFSISLIVFEIYVENGDMTSVTLCFTLELYNRYNFESRYPKDNGDQVW